VTGDCEPHYRNDFTAEDTEGRRVTTATDLNRLTENVIGCAMKVHSVLGPGLLESAYEACLKYELQQKGLTVQSQHPLPIEYGPVRLDVGYRLDLLVEEKVILELKAVERTLPIHEAQLLSYLKLSGLKVGLLLNFHVAHFRDGIKRMVNGL
jgi:GxxExxY protein